MDKDVNLRQLDVNYDSKAHGNFIDPYEWNQNFKKIEEVFNYDLDIISSDLLEFRLDITKLYERINGAEYVEIGTEYLPDEIDAIDKISSCASTFLWPVSLIAWGSQPDVVRINELHVKTTQQTTVKFFKCAVVDNTVVIEKVLGSAVSNAISNIAVLKIDGEEFTDPSPYTILACTDGDYIACQDNGGLTIEGIPLIGENTVYFSLEEGDVISFSNTSSFEQPILAPICTAGYVTLIRKNLYEFMMDISERMKILEGNTDYPTADIYDILKTLREDVDDLLYVPINIDNFSISPSTAEYGQVIKNVTVTWKLNTPAKRVKATFAGVNVQVTTDENGQYSFGSVELTKDSTNKTFTLQVWDERNGTHTVSKNLDFMNNVLYGHGSNFTSASFTKVLTTTRKRTFTTTANAGEYIWYCVPVRLGECTFKVGVFEGGFTLVDTVPFKNQYGYEEDYYIYKSNQDSLGKTTVEVT